MAAFVPGDTIAFKAGTTCTGTLNISSSGTSTNPIVITSYGSGAKPIIDSQNAGTHPRGIIPIQVGTYSAAVQHVVIDGLKLQHSIEDGGVRIGMPGGAAVSYITVRNCEIHDTGYGVQIEGTGHNLITGNHVHDLKMVVNTVGGDDDYGAVCFGFGASSDNEVSYNRCENAIADSYDYIKDGGFVELYPQGSGSANNNYFHHNYVRTTMGVVEVTGTNSNNKFAYNVILDNRGTLISVNHSPGATTDFRFENNTVVSGAPVENGFNAYSFGGNPGNAGISYRNNIFVLAPGMPVVASGKNGFTHDHNIYAWTDGSLGSLGGLLLAAGETRQASPGFASLSAGDVHLVSSSPAVKAGVTLGYTADFDGFSIPQGAAPDIGAFESRP